MIPLLAIALVYALAIGICQAIVKYKIDPGVSGWR